MLKVTTNRIDYYKMDNENFKLWLIYLKTHPIIRAIKDITQ